MVPASHILILMCQREQTGNKSNAKEGRNKEEGLLIKQLVVQSSDLEKKKKNPLLSNRMTSNNVQQKHCRKLFTLKQTNKKIIHFKAKVQCVAFYSKSQITM